MKEEQKENSNTSRYYELLVQNAQKGEVYAVKLKSDPQVYSAIPLIPGRMQNEEPAKFVLNILAPPERKGVHELPLDEIESIEQKG